MPLDTGFTTRTALVQKKDSKLSVGDMARVLKTNPYHDKEGQFTSKEHASGSSESHLPKHLRTTSGADKNYDPVQHAKMLEQRAEGIAKDKARLDAPTVKAKVEEAISEATAKANKTTPMEVKGRVFRFGNASVKVASHAQAIEVANQAIHTFKEQGYVGMKTQKFSVAGQSLQSKKLKHSNGNEARVTVFDPSATNVGIEVQLNAK